jgi:hypothetical protein
VGSVKRTKKQLRLRIGPKAARLQLDGIPNQGKLRFLSIDLIAQRRLDITVLNQPNSTPSSNAHESTRRLYGKSAADMGQDKAAPAKHTFDINSSSYERISTNTSKN